MAGLTEAATMLGRVGGSGGAVAGLTDANVNPGSVVGRGGAEAGLTDAWAVARKAVKPNVAKIILVVVETAVIGSAPDSKVVRRKQRVTRSGEAYAAKVTLTNVIPPISSFLAEKKRQTRAKKNSFLFFSLKSVIPKRDFSDPIHFRDFINSDERQPLQSKGSCLCNVVSGYSDPVPRCRIFTASHQSTRTSPAYRDEAAAEQMSGM